MTPAGLFAITVLLTVAAAVFERIRSRWRRDRLEKLAAAWGMSYSQWDQFRLTTRVARNFPIPGAATIRVVDLIYGSNSEVFHYIFTAEYTIGIITRKRRIQRAASLIEPRTPEGDAPALRIELAPANLPLLEQYRTFAPSGTT